MASSSFSLVTASFLSGLSSTLMLSCKDVDIKRKATSSGARILIFMEKKISNQILPLRSAILTRRLLKIHADNVTIVRLCSLNTECQSANENMRKVWCGRKRVNDRRTGSAMPQTIPQPGYSREGTPMQTEGRWCRVGETASLG